MLSLEQELSLADFRHKIKAFNTEELQSICIELFSQLYHQKNSFIELQKHHWFTPEHKPESDIVCKLSNISDLFDEIFADLIDAEGEQREILTSASTSNLMAIMDSFDALMDAVIKEQINL